MNPKDAKVRLAREIVTVYHGTQAARIAEEEFENVFKNREKPSEMPKWKAMKSRYILADLLAESGIVKSKNEARRVVEQGGVKIDDVVVNDWQKEIVIKSGMVVQVGKRRFVQVVK